LLTTVCKDAIDFADASDDGTTSGVRKICFKESCVEDRGC
jgi:hypothetical protein